MKLYTKGDFLKAAEFCEVSMIDAKYIIERIDEVADPIELPSDEEIEETFTFYPQMIEGAKWMREKIQGGNK